MKDRYLVILEIETYDGDPRWWDWEKLSTGEDVIKIISSEFKGRVLPTEGEGDDVETISWSSSNPTGERESNE